jgi:hypothetical protein
MTEGACAPVVSLVVVLAVVMVVLVVVVNVGVKRRDEKR